MPKIDSLMPILICQYPNLSPATGYDKKCRCNRCRKAHAQISNKYYKNNKQKVALKTRNWVLKNIQHVHTAQKIWRQRNPEKLALYDKKHAIQGPRRFKVSQRVAKKRTLDFTLTLDVYLNLIKLPCYYCQQVTFGISSGVGLDRIDNSRGYIEGNVLPCCGDCNRHRSDTWTVEETKIAVQTVLSLRNSK